MAKKYEISEEGMNELREARIRNRDKSVERRLYALILHAEGNTGKKVSELTGYNEKYLYELYQKYLSGGLEAITGNHYGGNRRNMSYEEEEIFLSGWSKKLPRSKHPKSANPEAVEASKKLTLESKN